MAYATYSDVQARVAGRDIGASTKPTSSQVTQWITEAEAMLTGALNAVNVSTPITNTNGVEILKSWACDFAEGHIRLAWLADTGGVSDEAQRLVDTFHGRLQDIIDKPSFYEGMLNGGSVSAAERVRAYVLSNSDDKSIADGDFDPLVDEETIF
jgi:hypothetical protein